MKKTMILMLLSALAAGTAFAQEGNDENHGYGRSWNRDGGNQHNWGQRDERNDRQGWNQDRRAYQDQRGDEERPGGPLDPETMQKMREMHKAIHDLGEAARAETNETAKAELVTQLKTKLGEMADLIQANQEKRIAQAEERLASLKAKIDDAKKNRDTMLDEQVQRILSGQRPERPERFNDFPHAKGVRPEGGPEAGDEMAPPPAEEGAPAEAAPAEAAPAE